MKKSLKTLAKELDFNTGIEYYDYMIDSHINGQPQQCKELFAAMKREDKAGFINYLRSHSDIDEIFDFYLKLAL
jgi:hypothetical protein